MKNALVITRRQFLLNSSLGLVGLWLTGCGSLARPEASPTLEAKIAAPAATNEVTEVTFVIGVPPEEAYYQLANLALTEAFRRLDIKFQLKHYPGKRGTEMVEEGVVDGEAGRIYEFAASGDYPNHVRVEAPYIETRMMSFALNEAIQVDGPESLKGKGYRVAHSRNIKKLELLLPQVLEPTQIVVVDTNEQALKMLITERIDLYFATGDVYAAIGSPEFKDAGIKNVGLLYVTPVYPYLHKKHAALAPKLAEILGQMKTEGLMKQYEEQVHWVG